MIDSPNTILEKYPLSASQRKQIQSHRQTIAKILSNKNDKQPIILIIGPCSIHSPEETLAYAAKLKKLSEKVKDKFLVVMRVYFEKPRTVTGWPGFAYDPNLDESYDMSKGIEGSRKLLIALLKHDMPMATEFLNPLFAPYIEDAISWGAIGARTTESQIHRTFATNQKMPIGFKNPTSGDIQTAVNAVLSAKHSHSFLGIDNTGNITKISSKGNERAHIILRGAKGKPNYDKQSVQFAAQLLAKANLPQRLIVDCSHDNSDKDHKKQEIVFRAVVEQLKDGIIAGIMLESYINAGNQPIQKPLKTGVSITDKCMDWKTTERIVLETYKNIK